MSSLKWESSFFLEERDEELLDLDSLDWERERERERWLRRRCEGDRERPRERSLERDLEALSVAWDSLPRELFPLSL